MIGALGALLGLSLWGASTLWTSMGVEIGWFGWTVLGVGAVLTIGLGVGLMALSFHSARAGFDERAQALDQTLDRGRDGEE